jgi:hypothetical protein
MPKSVQEALELDKKNGNNLRGDAIKEEMQKVRVAFDIFPDGTTALIGYQQVRCHGRLSDENSVGGWWSYY